MLWKLTKIELKFLALVSIHETRAYLAIARHFVRATKGELAYGKLSDNLKINIIFIGALTTPNFLLSYILEG
ncbi:MAG: hypothetical protein ACQJCO_03415 [cyanobacterium endosymbiont of Rhopalodia sterrenbergii]